jgi:predicted ester cyclase
MPATSKRFAITVIDIVRFEGDKAVEHWGVTDVAGMMEQVALA